jgi:hypothetical protein
LSFCWPPRLREPGVTSTIAPIGTEGGARLLEPAAADGRAVLH